MNIVLVAGPKDHGPGEHDYPRWQAGWKELLAKAPKVRISTAFEWPKISQFELADVMIFYFWNHDWNNDRYAQLDEYLARGGGLVLLHAATIADKEPEMLSQRIGFAFQAGRSKFRHGPVRLEFTPADDPITRGLDGLDLVDETYWGLFGELTRVEVLATASEEGEARPAVWKYEPANGGRVFATVLGHYGWTFNDPLFRTIVLRGLAWAGGVPEGRLQRLATEGVTWDDARE